MDVEGTNLSLKDLLSPPPVMPWREFADWIRMSGRWPGILAKGYSSEGWRFGEQRISTPSLSIRRSPAPVPGFSFLDM